jgi:hypothetical protein
MSRADALAISMGPPGTGRVPESLGRPEALGAGADLLPDGLGERSRHEAESRSGSAGV